MLRLYNNSFQVSYRTVRTVQLVMFILLLRTWHFLHVSPTYATSAYKPWISGQQLGSTLPLEFRPLCQVESASNRTNHLASFSSLFFQKFKTLISYQFWERFVSELVITYFLSKKGIDYQMLWHLWRGLKTPLLTSSLHMTVVYLGYVADSLSKGEWPCAMPFFSPYHFLNFALFLKTVRVLQLPGLWTREVMQISVDKASVWILNNWHKQAW